MIKSIKKLSALLVILFSFCCLTACGASKEMKQEAEDRVKQYKPAFEEKVEEAYGKDAKLSDVKCDINATTSGVDFSTTYSIGTMYGTITIDGKSYRANYDYGTNTFVDNVHSDAIYKEIIEGLPFDSSKYIDTEFGELYLPPETDSLEKYVSLTQDNKFATFRQKIFITTTEDLSKYKDTDFDNISEIKKLNDSEVGFLTLRVVSLNDKSKSSSLIKRLDDIHFEYEDTHPEIQVGNESKDVFDEYDIKNAIEYPNQWQESHVMFME